MTSDPETVEFVYTTSSGVDSTDVSESDGKTLVLRNRRRRCLPVCSAQRVCHWCYVWQFLLFLMIFPLWVKWLLVNPKPREFWYEDYGAFPLLAGDFDSEELLQKQMKPKIHMSAIPESSGQCNYSCSAWRGYRTEEMNFRVSLSLNDSALTQAHAHTVYPVLLASADFQDWWVVSDRRFAHPRPFWSEHTAHEGAVFVRSSPVCTRPPPAPQQMPAGLSGTYVLACVTWDPDRLEELSTAAEVTDLQIANLCSSVGGVCGWSCGSTHPPQTLQGCDSRGTIKVTENSFAGKPFNQANFKGKVTMKQCPEVDEYGECLTKEAPFSNWKCHNCKYNPNEIDEDSFRRLQIPGMAGIPGFPGGIGGIPGVGGGDPDSTNGGIGGLFSGDSEDAKSSFIYDSLPKFQVTVRGLGQPDGENILSQPATVIFESSESTPGVWKPLYQAYVKTRPPVSVDAAGDPLVKVSDEDMEDGPGPAIGDFARYRMHFQQQNRLTIDPKWCYGKQGPLYLVACAVNGSVYRHKGFEGFTAGQKAAPPPFNDRCLEVSGRCAHACTIDQPAMPNCTSDGRILQSTLVGPVKWETNDSTAVRILCYMLILCFSLKVVLLCPGIFSYYSHYRRYDPDLTSSLRCINVCIASWGEKKSITLRSLIGAVACMPKACECRFHVTLTDDLHRTELKQLMEILTKIVDAIPGFDGNYTLEENIRQFFHVWVEGTKRIDIGRLRAEGGLEKEAAEYLSGRVTLQTLRENTWSWMDGRYLMQLDAMVEQLHEALSSTSDEVFDLNSDTVHDWEPKDRNALPLRMHYLARARPVEDERTVKSQHVAPGIYYYKVPQNPENNQWLGLRCKTKEMVYGLEEQDPSVNLVPIHTSRGLPGVLNFAANYMYYTSSRPQNLYQDDRDYSPYLFSICDPYHQYQPDFFHTTIPLFFDRSGELDEEVGLAQCPLYFHELAEELDYLDGNNAQFFRFHSMIQNCCGGVSSWDTNSTRLLMREDDTSLWHFERKRVREADRKRREHLVERRSFPETCKVEHIASSVNQVLRGQHSQFINRRLSYGMSRSGTEALASMQRMAEGHVLFWLQSFFGRRQGFMLWLSFIFFIFFVVWLCILVGNISQGMVVVEMGVLQKNTVDRILVPLVDLFKDCVEIVGSGYFGNKPSLIKIYVTMGVEFAIWLAGLSVCLLLLLLVTEIFKAVTACGLCSCFSVPNEMRHWARLLIRMHQTSHWVWAWLPAFWLGFNYWNVFAEQTYHFNCWGMFIFIVVLQVLNWGMIISASMRSTLQASMETNEVIFLSMDNLWRSTQSLYVTFPLHFYSFTKAAEDYLRYHFYGADVTFEPPYESSGERAQTSICLVKYWTLLLILGAIGAWVHYYLTVEDRDCQGSLASCIVVTLIALDVLHPCAYLWVGQSKQMSSEKAHRLSWLQACVSPSWWSRLIYKLVLNKTLATIVKWLGPTCFLVLTILCLVMPYMGINLAFMMLLGTSTY